MIRQFYKPNYLGNARAIGSNGFIWHKLNTNLMPSFANNKHMGLCVIDSITNIVTQADLCLAEKE